MSVRTTANEKIDLALDGVKTAIKALSEIVIDECWGSGDLDKDGLLEAMQMLLKVKSMIG